jgi:hypothetical protein
VIELQHIDRQVRLSEHGRTKAYHEDDRKHEEKWRKNNSHLIYVSRFGTTALIAGFSAQIYIFDARQIINILQEFLDFCNSVSRLLGPPPLGNSVSKRIQADSTNPYGPYAPLSPNESATYDLVSSKIRK